LAAIPTAGGSSLEMKRMDISYRYSASGKNQAFRFRIFRHHEPHTCWATQSVARIGNKKCKDSIPVLFRCFFLKDDHEDENQ
jgi:hypothetical protein